MQACSLLARGSVGTPASAERDLAELEVLLEVAPLLRSGLPVLLLGTCHATIVEEAAVGPDQVVLEDG